ncbi:hypothetical protein MUK42_32937 [Musa troglodytarum]|uniref:Uncharacterized protein n=1 Tax=Musa troglodytarum TaxID=320322 RepID=A0A9E7I9N4_9LILI|nr:hypothetical protein MUK42_32937 [Musa troglodytarum]
MGNQQKPQEPWHSMNQGKPPGRQAGITTRTGGTEAITPPSVFFHHFFFSLSYRASRFHPQSTSPHLPLSLSLLALSLSLARYQRAV